MIIKIKFYKGCLFLITFIIFNLPSIAQVYPGGSWQAAEPQSQGGNPKKLQEAMEFLNANSGSDSVSQVVVIRHGYLVYSGPKANVVHGVWSMTKSFVSTECGLLIEDGK